jgi:IS4 transposase
MAHPHRPSPGDALASFLTRATVEAQARLLGVVRRQRKVDIYALVWTLVLGFQVGATRTIDALRTAYQRVAGHVLERSSFYDRLTAKLAELLRQLAVEGLATLDGPRRVPAGLLAGFKDLLAIDSTVLRLHDWLSRNYAACRTNHTQAAAKLHLVMSVLSASPHRVKLTPERTSDQRPWRRMGQWVKGYLLLFDLGYFCYHLFDRIAANGGFFLSRLKANANPRIVAAYRCWRGQSIPVVGKRLRDVLPLLEREVLDVEVQIEFPRRTYRGKQSRGSRRFRLIALRDPERGGYHCYLTNVPAEDLPAEDVRRTYSLRWQVELLFKAMKHHGHLDQLPSRQPAVVECLVWASVLATLASQILHRLVRQALPADRYVPLLRWASLFARHAVRLLDLVLRRRGPADALALLDQLLHDAPDPNRNRQDRALAGFLIPE